MKETEQTQPLVTIGIPTYNRADGNLRQALTAAVNQTYPAIEIVISDNASSDSTGEVVAEFAKNDHRICYIRQEQNIGANNNFNVCVQEARGSYFLLLHDDDLIDADFVATCMEAVGVFGDVGIVRTGTRIIDGSGNVSGEFPNGVGGLPVFDFFLGWFSGETSLYLCSTLFNTARLREVGGFYSPANLFQDVVAEARLAAAYGRIDVREVKASFRRHGESYGQSARVEDWCRDCLYLLNLVGSLFKNQSQKAQIQRTGRLFLYRKCSRQVACLQTRWGRWKALWRLAWRFGCPLEAVKQGRDWVFHGFSLNNS